MAMVEAIKHWAHFLGRRKFTLITDQRSAAYIFDNSKKTKVKNNKMLNLRMELGAFNYQIVYRLGRENVVADALTRLPNDGRGPKMYACGISQKVDELRRLHLQMCCPGVKRLLHLVRSRNLPFAVKDVEEVCGNCTTCGEIKPRFFRPEPGKVIKATQPFERFSIDFRRPLVSSIGRSKE